MLRKINLLNQNYNCKNSRDCKLRKKKLGGLKRIISIEFEIDYEIFPCFTLWFFIVNFFSLIIFYKLIMKLDIKD
jgi:hypothetical protein